MRLLEDQLEKAEDLILLGEPLPLDLIASLNEMGVEIERFEEQVKLRHLYES